MEDTIISPCREKGEPSVEGCGLLLINPSEAAVAIHQALEMGGSEYFLFNSRLVQVPASQGSEPFFVAGPAVGAPMAVLTLEKLIALGCRHLIVYGWCGSLTRQLAGGSILLPVGAVSEEGTSPHYPIDEPAESSTLLRKRLAAVLEQYPLNITEGVVWTTDAPYRERRPRVEALANEGVLAVEMEFNALATVACFRKIELAAVLLVSDELWGKQWRPLFRQKIFKKTSRTVLQALIECCRSYSFPLQRYQENG